MAGEETVMNESMTAGLTQGIASAFANIPGIDMLIKIGQAVGIIFLIYIVFLIFKSIIQTRQALRLKSIAKSVEEINQKLDIIVGKKKPRK